MKKIFFTLQFLAFLGAFMFGKPIASTLAENYEGQLKAGVCEQPVWILTIYSPDHLKCTPGGQMQCPCSF